MVLKLLSATALSLVLVAALTVMTAGGQEAPAGGDAGGGLPEGWMDQPVGEFLQAFDAWVGGAPTDVEREEVAAHLISFLRTQSFVETAPAAEVLGVLNRTLEHLRAFYTSEVASEVGPLLEARLEAEPQIASSGAFDDVSENVWDCAQCAGVRRSVVAAGAAAWAQANDLTALSPERLAKLVWALEDDLVGRMEYSVRWSGSLTPQISGAHSLGVRIRGGRAKVSLSGEVVFDSDAPGGGASPTLVAGESYPLLVEFQYDAEGAAASDPAPEWIRSLFYGWSQAILVWNPAERGESVVPASALSPPPGFEDGKSGLRAEYFEGAEFAGEAVQTRLDPEVALVLQGEGPGTEHHLARRNLSKVSLVLRGAAPASNHGALQRQVAQAAAARLLSAEYLSGGDISELFWATWSLTEYLSTEAKTALLSAVTENPRSLDSVPADELYHFRKAHDHLPGTEADEVVLAWCARRPDLATEFGPYPTWEGDESYMHRNYGGYWHVARHMTSDSQVASLRSAIDAPSGGCNHRALRILAFALRERGEIDTLAEELDQRLAAEGLSGDRRASWLLARGFAEELRSEGEPSLLAGRDWIDDAFAASESEAVRFSMLRELVVRFAGANWGAQAIALLDGVAGEFAGRAEEIGEWRLKVDEIEDFYVAAKEKQRAESISAHVAELERRLAAAEDRGDHRRVKRYTRLLRAVGPDSP